MPSPRLSDLLNRETLTVFCEHGTLGFNRCGHSYEADIPALIQRYGDMTLDELRSRLVCNKCGHRNASFIIAPKRTGGVR